jgi:hypothetical protein
VAVDPGQIEQRSSDLDPTVADARKRMAGGERRWTAADSPARLGIELGCSIGRADDTRAKRVRRRSNLGRRGRLGPGGDGALHGEAERCGSATPASPPRRLDARGRQQAAPGSFSPPCTAPGRLVDGGAAPAAENSGDDALGFRRGCSGAARVLASPTWRWRRP